MAPENETTSPRQAPDSEPLALLQPTESLGYMTNLTARLFARALQARIGPLGLSTGQFPILVALWLEDGRTQGALLETVEIEQPTMANTLARMERDGLVRRRPDPDDRRRQLIWLTERGRALARPAIAAAHQVNGVVAGELREGERILLLGLLGRVQGALREALAQGEKRASAGPSEAPC